MHGLRHLDDAAYLAAIYGDPAAYLAARQRNYDRNYGPNAKGRLFTRTDRLIYLWLGIGGAILIAAALIAHGISTGTW